MNSTTLAEKARAFLAMHQGPKILVLPNAWDVASARIFEDAGFPAIATTSAGVANSLGYADVQQISRDEMLEVVERIAHAVDVPVTADVEAGYGSTPAEIAATARATIAAGAVGMNFEDSSGATPGLLADVTLQCECIRAALAAATAMGVGLVLNARTDAYLGEIGEPATRFDATVARLNAYREAGAPCLFAPGVKDPEIIGRLVRAVRGPLNILATVGAPPIPELERLGVARVSVGSGAMRATLGLLQRIAHQLRDERSFSLMTDGAMSYVEANRISAGQHKP
jgi:2-methylisocitrate lyase-like PEP mutase family enzyme